MVRRRGRSRPCPWGPATWRGDVRYDPGVRVKASAKALMRATHLWWFHAWNVVVDAETGAQLEGFVNR